MPLHVPVEIGWPRHPKAVRLSGDLQDPWAWARMVALWLYVLEFYPDGHVDRMEAEELARAMLYQPGEPHPPLLPLLKKRGLVDRDGRIHDWNERAGKLWLARVKDRERKIQERQGSGAGSPGRPQDVRRTSVENQREKEKERENKKEKDPSQPPRDGGRTIHNLAESGKRSPEQDHGTRKGDHDPAEAVRKFVRTVRGARSPEGSS